MKKQILLLLTVCLLSANALLAQIRFTEIAPTNTGQLVDEDGDRPDWIEIQNGGTQVANLAGWSLSDGSKTSRWILPETNIEPGERLLVFASGKNRGAGVGQPSAINHWETALNDSDQWRYLLGTNPPPADWNTLGFVPTTWSAGAGGFGYGDGDDATVVPTGTISLYYRQTFTVADPAKLVEAVLSMDYDDGFVAYLNGQEIARSSNLSGPVDNATLAIPDREATGLPPEDYPINALALVNLLVPGQNVLAVEIHNTAANSSDMTGRSWLHFGVSDDSQFFGPIPFWFNPGGASGGVLHSDFKLNFTDTPTLYDPAGNIVDSLTIGVLQPGHTQMRINDDGAWCITAAPTPGNTNGWDCLIGYSDAPGFSLPAGFYTGLTTTALTGAGEIRFTTDGSEPNETSTLYNSPIQVGNTTVVRARCFEANKLPSAVATATYFIDEPTQLTVVSISLPPDDFPSVYDNHNAKGRVAVEYFDKDKKRQFAGDFAGYVVGNWSVDFPQKSLQFDADEDYGSLGDIQYPIFAPDKPIQEYHSFRIRNEDDDWQLARMRDRIVNELAAETHAGRAAYRNVAAFINGQYWGHYVARERLDNYFVRDNYGADPDSVNMVKTHFGQGDYLAEYGSIDDFYAMSDFITNNNMGDQANFQQAAKLLDLENFTDYLETEIFVASTDWLQDYFNNIRLFKTEKKAPWKFLLWDVSYSSGAGSGCSSCDVLGSTLGNNSRYGQMLNSLLDNTEYRRFFINRFADLMNTAFLSDRAYNLIDANAAELGTEIVRHNERWGTGDFNAWTQAVFGLQNFYEERPSNQRQHIIDNFQLDQEVSITLNVNPPGAGTVKISTVIPKELPWTGIYFHGNPVTVTAIPNPGYTFNNWTNNPNINDPLVNVFTADVPGNTTFTANFTGAAAEEKLEISEINYHSDPTRDGGDWFELRNEGDEPVDISGYWVKDQDWFHRFEVPVGTVIPAQKNLVFAENIPKFTAEYPGVTEVLPWPLGFELSDKNDEIHVYNRSNEEAAWAIYRDEAPWETLADGYGLTLEYYVTGFNPADPYSWFAGCVGGSPGTYHSYCEESFVLTEINYHAATVSDAGDWFELRNGSTEPQDLSGWQMRDGSNDHLFIFPPGTILTPVERYRVFYEDDAKFSAQFPDVSNKTGPIGFSLNNSTDMIRLYEPNGRLYLSMRYNDSFPWPAEADGGGYTMQKKAFSDLLNDPYSWQKGCPGGSPGKDFDPDCGIVGTDEIASGNQSMQAWPNPGHGLLYVKMSAETTGTVQMQDIYGKTVAQQPVTQGEAVFQTAHLPAGVYILTSHSSGKSLITKVVLN